MFLLTEYYSSNGMTQTDFEVLLGVYTTMLFGLLVYALANSIVLALLYKKHGIENWWGAFIPIFNSYVYVTTTFKKQFWPIIFVPFGLAVLSGIPILGLIFSLANLVFAVYLSYNFAKAFGKSDGQAVLYVIFPTIMGLVFLLSKETEYKGPRKFITE